ncbi:cytochrome P450 [Xylariaceae sp. FL1272]|nr:cytochrome P450 [Xylariaceae sp. FL1272]
MHISNPQRRPYQAAPVPLTTFCVQFALAIKSNPMTMWTILGGLLCLWILTRSLYRLTFHPLSHIPGPKLAAVSRALEFYHDVIRGGMYIWEVEKMHEKYGPVVRINPREVHVKDPYFYDEVYAPSSRRRDKDPDFISELAFKSSMIATIDHDLHRRRRAMLNTFFSKQSVLRLSPVIQEKVDKLMTRFEQIHREDVVVTLDDGYSALTCDIISHYAWGQSAGYLEDPTFKSDVRSAMNELTSSAHITRFFPSLGDTLLNMPRWVLSKIRPGVSALLDIQDMATESRKTSTREKHETLFHALSDASVPPQERTPRRMADEGMVVIVAGTETTARTLTIASYHLFNKDKSMLIKLREELRVAMPDPTTKLSWSELEQLPYLNAVVCEAIRLSYGPVMRSTRVAPDEVLEHGDIQIPPGTPVSMSTYFVHMDQNIFPDPQSFKPERWIEAAKQGQNLKRFIVAFSRGSRICLGMNLAYAELFMTLAALVRRFDMELYESHPDDVRMDQEMGLAASKRNNFSVRAKITKVFTD